ncbi:MAG: hypothetical protein EOO47_03320 [Flavobacterium sp.]|nr:MAG: hypothetical protein EOO47_03320 [Flavobacterium sp.]
MKKLLSISCFVLLLNACTSNTKTVEEPKSTLYKSDEIGWEIEIPAGFNKISQARIDANDKLGKEAVGKVYDGDVKVDSLRHLVSFNKNRFNLFDSTIEPYTEQKPGEYEANNQLIKKLIFDTYAKQGIKIDTSSNKIEVSGLQFHAFYIKVFGPNGTTVLNQVMFNRAIRNYDFGINITFNNSIDSALLIDAFKQSKFDK